MAALALNLVIVPPVAFGLSQLASGGGAVELGVLLVLLAPCIDYVIVFTRLAGGSDRELLTAAPLLMLAPTQASAFTIACMRKRTTQRQQLKRAPSTKQVKPWSSELNGRRHSGLRRRTRTRRCLRQQLAASLAPNPRQRTQTCTGCL